MASDISLRSPLETFQRDLFLNVISNLDIRNTVRLLEIAMPIIAKNSSNINWIELRRHAYFNIIERDVEAFPDIPYKMADYLGAGNIQNVKRFFKFITIASESKKVFRQLNLSHYQLSSEMFEKILDLPACQTVTNFKLGKFLHLNENCFQKLPKTLEVLHVSNIIFPANCLNRLSSLTSLTITSGSITLECLQSLATQLPLLFTFHLTDYSIRSNESNELASLHYQNWEISPDTDVHNDSLNDYKKPIINRVPCLPQELRELSLQLGNIESHDFAQLPHSLTTLSLEVESCSEIDSNYLPRTLTSFTYHIITAVQKSLSINFFEGLPTKLQHLSLRRLEIETDVKLKHLTSLNSLFLSYHDFSKECLLDLPENLTQLDIEGGELNGSCFQQLPRTLLDLALTINIKTISDEQILQLPDQLLFFDLRGFNNSIPSLTSDCFRFLPRSLTHLQMEVKDEISDENRKLLPPNIVSMQVEKFEAPPEEEDYAENDYASFSSEGHHDPFSRSDDDLNS